MDDKLNKYCAVPQCMNNSSSSPDLVFFPLPFESQEREKWFQCMTRNHKTTIPKNCTGYCCEVHFDLQKDTIERYDMDGNIVLDLDDDVIPHKFECQMQKSPNKPTESFINNNDTINCETNPSHKTKLPDDDVENNIIKYCIKQELGSENSDIDYEDGLNLSDAMTVDIKTEYDIDIGEEIIQKTIFCATNIMEVENQTESYNEMEHRNIIKCETDDTIEIDIEINDDVYVNECNENGHSSSIAKIHKPPKKAAKTSKQRKIIKKRKTRRRKCLNAPRKASKQKKITMECIQTNPATIHQDTGSIISEGPIKRNSTLRKKPIIVLTDIMHSNNKLDSHNLDRKDISDNESNSSTISRLSSVADDDVYSSMITIKTMLGVSEENLHLIRQLIKIIPLTMNEILITLKKIQFNSSFKSLSSDFQCSYCNIKSIISRSVPIFAKRLKTFIFWPKKMKLLRLCPILFRKRFSNLSSIIDVLEIKLEEVLGDELLSLTYSKSKGYSLFNFLLSFAPNGLINFVSDGIGGKIPEQFLLDDYTNYLNHLPKHTTVIVDRPKNDSVEAFWKEKITKHDCILCNLNNNPFKYYNLKLNLLYYKDQVSARLRQFEILNPGTIIDRDVVDLLDDIVVMTCGITNMLSLNSDCFSKYSLPKAGESSNNKHGEHIGESSQGLSELHRVLNWKTGTNDIELAMRQKSVRNDHTYSVNKKRASIRH